MSDFFHTNPLIVQYVHADVGKLISENGCYVVDQAGRHLANAHEDLGEGGGRRFLNDFTRSMTNSRRFVVDSAQRHRLLMLHEQRTRRRSTTSVSWPNGQHVGTVTMERMRGAARSYLLMDAYGRELGRIMKHDPHQGRGMLGRIANHDPLQGRVYTAADHRGHEVARITMSKRSDTSRGYQTYVSDHTLQLHYSELPEPLSTLLRASAITIDFAEFAES